MVNYINVCMISHSRSAFFAFSNGEHTKQIPLNFLARQKEILTVLGVSNANAEPEVRQVGRGARVDERGAERRGLASPPVNSPNRALVQLSSTSQRHTLPTLPTPFLIRNSRIPTPDASRLNSQFPRKRMLDGRHAAVVVRACGNLQLCL